MTCISCTASIDCLLVRALEHILAALSFISFCSFLCYSIVFSLPCVLHMVLLVVFFVDLFSCENKSSHKKKTPESHNVRHYREGHNFMLKTQKRTKPSMITNILVPG